MQEVEIINMENQNIDATYEHLINEAYKLFPNLRSDLKAVSDANVSIESYRNYMNIVNQSPSVITTSHVS